MNNFFTLKINRLLFFFAALFFAGSAFCQSIHVEGFVLENNTLEPLSGVSCINNVNKEGTFTNAKGYFSLHAKKGKINLVFTFAGFTLDSISLNLQKDTLIKIIAKERAISEIKITAKEENLVKQALMGKTSMSAKQINKIPSFVGIPDIIKTVTIHPGVTTGKEGFSNYYVRGGNRGQNQVLLDGLPILNTNHVFGLLSQFNTDVIKTIDFYRGGFPARYGGRTASVLNISLKEGNKNQFRGKLYSGLLNSGVMLEGPIKRGKTSYCFGARFSWYDLLAVNERMQYDENKPLGDKSEDEANIINHTFYDINFKLTHRFNLRKRLSLVFFRGEDIHHYIDSWWDYRNIVDIRSNNQIVALQYDKMTDNGMIFKSSLAFSSFQNKSVEKNEELKDLLYKKERYNITSGCNNLFLSQILEINKINKHRIKFGGQLEFIRINPGETNKISQVEFYENQTDTLKRRGDSEDVRNISLFAEDDIELTKTIKTNIGVRTSIYNTDEITNFIVEPRLSIRWMASENKSLKCSYSRLSQNIHIIQDNLNGIAQDYMVCTTKNIPPEKSWQIACGFFGDVKNIKFEWGIEGYFKKMNNLIEYYHIDESSELLNNWESVVTKNGTGISFGLEITAKKEFKNLKVDLYYTISKSTRKFPELNDGKAYPYSYDKLHDLSIGLYRKLKRSRDLSLIFTFNSGCPISLPDAFVKSNKFFYEYYASSGINNQRLPVYHRLDISYKKNWKKRKNRNLCLAFNVYNLYARNNAAYVYFSNGKAKKVALFSILPTVNLSYEF